MNNPLPTNLPLAILELALHAMLSERCKQAYLHDLRNGMQGVSGGYEVLKRLLKNASTTVPTPLSIDKSTEMVRRSLTSHEDALGTMIDQLIPSRSAPGADQCITLRIDELLRELAKFLNSDAAAREVSLTVSVDAALHDAGLTVTVRPQAVRLTMLGLLVDAIDSMPSGGQVRLEARSGDGDIFVDFVAIPAQGELHRNYETIWQLNLAAEPLRNGLLFYVVRHLVQADGGTIDFAQNGGGSKASVRYPSTKAA